MKKILAIILALAMALAVAPFAFADGEEEPIIEDPICQCGDDAACDTPCVDACACDEDEDEDEDSNWLLDWLKDKINISTPDEDEVSGFFQGILNAIRIYVLEGILRLIETIFGRTLPA